MQKFLKLKKRIKTNEGFRNFSYNDILGFKTIGYGHLIKNNEKKLLKGIFPKKKLELIFEEDFNSSFKSYTKVYQKEKHPKNVQEVLIEMIFQLGIKKQIKFKRMNKYIKNKKYYMAALEMKKSLWYKQTAKRVDILIDILLNRRNEK